MNSKLFIPEKIKAGYQNRNDTFTKRLAYVIYYDEKGVLRKEKSWQSWRDDKIEPLDVENKPYSGFTLNKGILRDGYWGGGHNMVRIYDDRGIEFEITISNLMYILMGNDCNKRVLSGEFVYAWNGTELILLPTNTEEFKVSTTFTSLKTNNVTMKELQSNVGCLFKTKDLDDIVYLGRLEYNEKKWESHPVSDYKQIREPRHVFYNIKSKNYFYEKSTKKLAYLVDATKVHNFEELLEGYFNSQHHIQVSEIVLEVGEDITDRFTSENKSKPFSEDGKSVYFIGSDGNYYHAYSPQNVARADKFIKHSKWVSNIYFRTIPKKEGWYENNDAYYQELIKRECTPIYNEGYNEWNIQQGNLKFNLLKVTLKSLDGREAPVNASNGIRDYFFTNNVIVTTKR